MGTTVTNVLRFATPLRNSAISGRMSCQADWRKPWEGGCDQVIDGRVALDRFKKRLAISADGRGCVMWQKPLERPTHGRFLFVVWWGDSCSAMELREEGRGAGRVSFCYHNSRATTSCPRCCRAIGVDDELGIQVSDEWQIGVVSSWEPGGAMLSACTLQMLEVSQWQEKKASMGALWANSAGKWLVKAYAADRQLARLSLCRAYCLIIAGGTWVKDDWVVENCGVRLGNLLVSRY